MHESPHVPLEHSCPARQAFPHAPQLLPSPNRSTQTPPQSVRPAAQTQVPNSHRPPAEHCTPHPPQLAASAEVSMQLPLQSKRLAGHVHWPFTQPWPAPHPRLHAPQCEGSELRDTHAAPQRVWPAGQPSAFALAAPAPPLAGVATPAPALAPTWPAWLKLSAPPPRPWDAPLCPPAPGSTAGPAPSLPHPPAIKTNPNRPNRRPCAGTIIHSP